LRHTSGSIIEGQGGGEVIFSWQGGEPTLAGLDFFRSVVEIQEKYRKPHQRVLNDLQTNGTLLDDEWAAFLKEHEFMVGLSCDGPERPARSATVSTRAASRRSEKVKAAARLLRAHRYPVQRALRDEPTQRPGPRTGLSLPDAATLSTRRVQFIPCVEPRTFESGPPRSGGPIVGQSRSKARTPRRNRDRLVGRSG
jgi:uncharacterized protein